MKKILSKIENAIKQYSDCVIMGILPFLDHSDYCLIKDEKNFYFCKVDTEKLYEVMYSSKCNNINNVLHNFVTIVE